MSSQMLKAKRDGTHLKPSITLPAYLRCVKDVAFSKEHWKTPRYPQDKTVAFGFQSEGHKEGLSKEAEIQSQSRLPVTERCGKMCIKKKCKATIFHNVMFYVHHTLQELEFVSMFCDTPFMFLFYKGL